MSRSGALNPEKKRFTNINMQSKGEMETTTFKYYCNCLNICIHVEEESDRLTKCDLSEEEKESDFFQQLPLIVIERCMVSEQHTALIQLIVVGSWIVHKCTLCSTYTYASKCDESTTVVFVNSSLQKLSDRERELMKNRSEYSSVFQVFVKDPLYTLDANGTSHITSETSRAVSELKGLLIQKLEGRRRLTDEIIKKFVQEQEDALKDYTKRANEDFQSIKYTLLSHRTSDNSDSKVPMKNSLVGTNVNFVINDVDLPANPTKAEQKMKERNCSLDSEGLFLFDELGDNNVLEDEDHSDEDLSDTDDSGSRDEGIHIPRRMSIAFAKSLPIKMQGAFDPSSRLFDDDRFDDNNNRGRLKSYDRKTRYERPVDIAESMKALAKSVNGDTIFGDLPPPRIGSRI